MELEKLKIKISKFIQTPGVYIFRNKSRKIIYIGKATNLRSRVRSYFSDYFKRSDLKPAKVAPQYGRPIEAMIHEVADIKTIETDSVLEALILESGLIKKNMPKYNAMGKDDKSFSYFVITKEKFPRVVILRKTDLDIFKRSDLSRPKRPKEVGPLSVTKAYGPYTSKKQMEIALKIIRKIFPFHSNRQQTEKGCLDFQIGNCPGPYAGAITQEDYQKNIRGIQMILEGRKKSLLKKLEKEMKEFSKKHEYEKAAELRNKIFALKHIQDVALISADTYSVERGAWSKDKNDMRYAIRDTRIEAYDISNISGQYATGSMIVFKNGEPDKSQYRKFKIKTLQGADDVGMMREVLLRRFKNDWPASTHGDSSTRGWPQPDLILLDGGKGHLNMGKILLRELGIIIPIVAVAKGKSRKNLNFQFSIFNQFSMTQFPNEIKNLLVDKKLVKRIMNEAHRFAIVYHKKLRRENALK